MRIFSAVLFAALVIGSAPVTARNTSMRVKDVATLVGVRPTPLIGYGLVIGLNRTGDRRQTMFSNQS
ncbi:MAG TPA: flagellar basal body P-ring protein FlgI, partial [Luteitalea sp.]|nr:flagellar basal body P-ring protein FlgI [Luteitalea sp.]